MSSRMCDKWSKTIHLDGFIVQSREVWVANLSAVTVHSGGQLPGQPRLAASCSLISELTLYSILWNL